MEPVREVKPVPVVRPVPPVPEVKPIPEVAPVPVVPPVPPIPNPEQDHTGSDERFPDKDLVTEPGTYPSLPEES